MTATKTAAPAVIKPCICGQYATDEGDTGCTKSTLRDFAPGHDAKLKTFLIKAGAAGLEVTRTVDGIATSNSAEGHAAAFRFGYMVEAGIKRHQAKAEEKAARKAARQAKKAPKVTAKVGRATYEGRMEGDTFVYTVKGKERRTTKHTLVK